MMTKSVCIECEESEHPYPESKIELVEITFQGKVVRRNFVCRRHQLESFLINGYDVHYIADAVGV